MTSLLNLRTRVAIAAATTIGVFGLAAVLAQTSASAAEPAPSQPTLAQTTEEALPDRATARPQTPPASAEETATETAPSSATNPDPGADPGTTTADPAAGTPPSSPTEDTTATEAGATTPETPAAPPVEPAVQTAPDPAPACPGSVDEMARQVVAGAWGAGDDRVARLTAAGCDAAAVQQAVNASLPARVPSAPAPRGGGQANPVSSGRVAPAPSTSGAVAPAAPADDGGVRVVGMTTITGGDASQRAIVAGVVGAYGGGANVRSVSLNSSGHLGSTYACTRPSDISLNIAQLGHNEARIRQILAHEIQHAKQNVVYGCLHSMPDVYNQFGGFEAMTDCMTQAATGSSAYLSYKTSCSAEEIRLASIVVRGSRI